MKRALDLHHGGDMFGEHRQRFQIVSPGPTQAQDSRKVFEIKIVLPDEERKRGTSEGAMAHFLYKWVSIDRLPDGVCLLAYLRMERCTTHRPPLRRGG
jgi:hypothetical protein